MPARRLLSDARHRAGIAQGELARRAGTSQPAVARIERGHSSPTLETLERLIAAAGFELRFELVPKAPADPLVEAYKRDVDRTLLQENLRKSIDERLRSLAELQEFGNELQRSVKARKGKRK